MNENSENITEHPDRPYSRWRTMPWMVTLLGILVISLGLVSIFLAIAAAFMFFIDANVVFTLTSISAGLVVAILSLFRGTKIESYSLRDKYVR